MASYPARPQNPNVGDTWFDPIQNQNYIWTGNEWVPHPGPIGSIYYGNNTSGSFAISNNTTPTNVFEVNTPSGRIRANMATGEVDIPPGLHRSSALWEFWQGFKQVYQPSNLELNLAKNEISFLRKQLKEYGIHVAVETTDKIAEKVQKKYGNEKFIMLKPDDLIKFIKGDS